ncbi:MAG TPA: peptide ABC transporter substrate-binding protein, partial [Synergistales bacterium]|nr:peptide ABC transporter substrate-binding protein [Synergistales bacterium]
IDQGKTMPDRPEREALYKKLQQLVGDARPMLYLYNEENFFGVNKNVQNFRPSPRGYHNVTGVTFKE